MEYMARTCLSPRQVLWGDNVKGVYGCSHWVSANLLLQAAANAGKGGVLCRVIKGEGLHDPKDPWGQPKGDLLVKVGVCVLPPFLFLTLFAAHTNPLRHDV